MDEISLIRRFWEPLGRAVTNPSVREGIGNDGAVIATGPGYDQVITMDTLLEGVHFPASIDAHALGWRALAVNLSDLAAMGADPVCYTLSLTLPEADEYWLEGFCNGLRDLSSLHGVQLVGGDTTRGPLSITIQAQGRVPAGSSVARGRGCPGDRICVSGSLGDAGEALNWLGRDVRGNRAAQSVLGCYYYPAPRLALGTWLREQGVAAIDISDGLLTDLERMLGDDGRCGARLDYRALPVSAALESLAGDDAPALAASAGDDYELCFLWSEARGEIPGAAELDLPVTVVGRIESEPGIRLMDGDEPVTLASRGYSHFPGGSDE